MAKLPQPAGNLWVVKQRSMWGDYGDVLISGYARREADDSPLALHRTGPFLPPLSFPWVTNTTSRAVVVSADFKQMLESLNVPGVSFREAAKARIIPLSWETWDLDASRPRTYPEDGEPENYVWNETHDAACAASMLRAFELVLPVGPIGVDRVENADGSFADDFVANSEAKDLPPIFRSHPQYGQVIVGEELKAWLEQHAGSWVRFSRVRPFRPSTS